MRGRFFIGLESALLAFVALLAIVVLEMIVAAAVLPPGIGWDPVSLWHQSIRGKLFVLIVAGLPLCIPILVFLLVFVFVKRRLSAPQNPQSSMRNPV